jgi:hypothetical protein
LLLLIVVTLFMRRHRYSALLLSLVSGGRDAVRNAHVADGGDDVDEYGGEGSGDARNVQGSDSDDDASSVSSFQTHATGNASQRSYRSTYGGGRTSGNVGQVQRALIDRVNVAVVGDNPVAARIVAVSRHLQHF